MEKNGLTEKEAKKKLEKYGTNEIKESLVVSPFKILFRQIKKNFMVYLLLIAAVLSFLVGKSITSYTILVVILLIVIIGFIQEYRAEKAIKSLKGMLVPVSIVIRDGKEKEILSKEIVPGDILLLRNGEKIPADCIVIEEKELLVNESILTGEVRETRKIAVKNEENYSEKNLIYMGSFIVNGKCFAKVVHTGMKTKFGSIASMISTAEKELPLQNKVNKISKYMAVVAVVFSILTGLFMIVGKPASENLLIDALILVIALAVSAFPEGFPVVLITSLATGVYKMAQKNAIVNRMSIIETLGETTVICSDKTGTITKGEMTVSKIFADNHLIDITGTGYEGTGDFMLYNKKINPAKDEILSLLIKSSVICNDARIERTGEDNFYSINGTPTEASLLIMAAKAGVHSEDLEFKKIEEKPFDSKRKMMSILCKLERQNYVFSKGAPEVLLEKCGKVQKSWGLSSLNEKEKKRILELNKKLTSNSLRTIAVAYKKISVFSKDHFEEDLVFLGLIGMEDPPREEVKDSIALCIKAGINVKMITGDNKETAVAISKSIGLKGKVIEGKDLDKMDEIELSKIVSEIAVFARVKPEHKLMIVKALKINGEIVTMTGDGVNDAPALKEAHIGIAMGKNGTDVSREVADLTLKDDNFATIIVAIREGRTIFKNIRKFISYQLSCNYAELMILFVGVLLAPFLNWQIPLLLALQILLMNLVTDDLPALTLSLHPSSSDIMEEKPRKKKEILNKSLIVWFGIAGISMAIMTLSAFFISFNILHQSTESARTTALLSLICLEIANAYNFTSFRHRASFKSLKTNKYLLYASLLSILITVAVIYSPLNKIFGTVPVGVSGWVIGLFAAIIIIIIFNLLKKLNEKKNLFNLEHF
ncbi:cation-transporting P-type ATPase [Candidatus Pacearchaeota archaeon]|nr:cation-transporting P-type ATPase [Candidatus Pacearchaeota archaeon]